MTKTKTETILGMYRDNPTLSNAEIAKLMGASNRYVRKVLNPIRNNTPELQTVKAINPAKILLFDIENAPMEVFVWRLFKNLVLPHQVKKDWSILSWSAKWLFDTEMHSAVVTGEEAKNRDDSSVTGELWKLFDEADIIIGHNSNRFDIPKANTRFLLNGLTPPSPYRMVDTLGVLKRTFSFSSNKLEYVNDMLGILNKAGNSGMKMWIDAVDGDESALNDMLEYNKVDVLALEELYMILRPWIKSHPNVNLYQDISIGEGPIKCTNCGSPELDWNGKRYYTPAGRFMSFRCMACGAIGRNRYSDLTTADRKSLGLSVAS